MQLLCTRECDPNHLRHTIRKYDFQYSQYVAATVSTNQMTVSNMRQVARFPYVYGVRDPNDVIRFQVGSYNWKTRLVSAHDSGHPICRLFSFKSVPMLEFHNSTGTQTELVTSAHG